MGQSIRRELRNIGKKLSELGLVIGEGGNISARDGEVVYIKRRGASMEKALLRDYIPISLKTGRPMRRRDKPSIEIHMHLACYRSRDDVKAVIHTHPIFATAFCMAKKGPKILTYEAAAYLQSPIACIGRVPPGTSQLKRAVGKAVKGHNALLLKNHGLVTVGKSIEKAYFRTLAVERAAMVYLLQRLVK